MLQSTDQTRRVTYNFAILMKPTSYSYYGLRIDRVCLWFKTTLRGVIGYTAGRRELGRLI